MNVLLISQCSKNALIETRRILDQFAERRGDRTWQTSITMDGLNALRKLLRKTARKNTAVACHWIRGKDHSELMWIVGDASQFNSEGAVPTNTTQRDMLRKSGENDWHTGEIIRLLAQIAALLHDLGKASIAFQEQLQRSLCGKPLEKNLYRHEWVSLRLFLAFVGEDDDEAWLERLANEENNYAQLWTASGRYLRDGIDASGDDRYPFRNLTARAPLAAALGWLVVTHHRLPVKPVRDIGTNRQEWLGKRASDIFIHDLPELLSQVAHNWNEMEPEANDARAAGYWRMQGELPVLSPAWKKQAAKVARRLRDLPGTRQRSWLDNPYVMHLARLCLMLGDHHYSSLGVNQNGRAVDERLAFLQPDNGIAANTTFDQYGKRRLNQSLLEHLLGVAHGAAAIARALPGFELYLPRLVNHRGLRKRSGNPRFAWQDKAYDAAMSVRETTAERGAFIVNMASTGCGKTLANARILYALSDPQQGMRATYALGLRTLTLQTGRSYRNDLHLSDDELAILVGGSASRALFEYYEAKAEQCGSASIQSLIEEDSHVLYEGNTADHPLLAKALANSDIRKLLSASMLVCTVDHLVPATEAQRAGRQIAPMLRLMSSDLILDELDDYDLNDLPALTRLVYWAGLLGARVILSSATLPPALVQGMFMAYRAGREHYRQNRGVDGGQVAASCDTPCLWVDEFGTSAGEAADADCFARHHQDFVSRRVSSLARADVLRRAEILPLDIPTRRSEEVYAAFAGVIRDGCLRLHHAHAESDPVSGKQVSFGIVRMANIEPLIAVAKELYALGAPDETHLHLCVYHSRFPLLQRSAIENLLDKAFNRRDDDKAIYHLPEIRQAIDRTSARHQLFVVLASPVCEVGRDWDADWALAELSSLRSLIQLAGRVQRHRRRVPEAPNILLLDAPIKYFTRGESDAAVYQNPGFEKGPSGAFRLKSPWLHKLLAPEEYQAPSAIPRIRPRSKEDQRPTENLVDLEQARMMAAMCPRPPDPATARRRISPPRLERDEAAASWQFSQAMLTAVLPQQQPFRDSAGVTTATLVFLPTDDGEELVLHRVEETSSRHGEKLYVTVSSQLQELPLQVASGIGPWKNFDLPVLLQEQAEALDMAQAECARRMAVVEVLKSEQGWYWHHWLGFSNKE